MSLLSESENSKPDSSKKGSFYVGFLFFAGILLPSASFFIELFSRWCAQELFDPMPTWWHVLFVFFVPATNLQTWLAIRKGSVERMGWLGFANAVTIFIAFFYTILFAPVTPIAIFALIVFIGLLPLAPLFSLIAAIMMRRELRKLSSNQKPFTLRWQGLAASFLAVFLAVGLAELSLTITKIGILRANAANPAEQNAGLDFLRKYGDRDYLLRLCYDNSGLVTTDLFVNLLTTGVFSKPVDQPSSTEQARRAFYHLTGKHYRQMPTPRGVRHWESFEGRDFADDRGSIRINRGLSLVGSQMDGSVDGDAALGYLEWTLTFKNEEDWQQEALAQIQLPPGAVVSRLTLWINGEEREAAFAKSAKVIEAYNAVTATRRDPALVTASGKDRISLKCFPVQPKDEMKVRIGITAPLVLENESHSLLSLPYFQDRNFAVPTSHAFWIESKKALEISDPTFVQEHQKNVFAVRGIFKDESLMKTGASVRARKSEELKYVWAKDAGNQQTIVQQEIRQSLKPKTGKIVFVVDASISMKEFQPEIVEAIKTLTPDTETVLVLTSGNGLNSDFAAPNSFTGSPKQAADIIADASFDGGTDSVPAIEKAWELAQSNGAIVWLHAPQSVELEKPANLAQFWTRRPNSAPIYSLQVTSGKDVVGRILNESNLVNTVPRYGSLREDLWGFLQGLNDQKKVFEAVRTVDDASKFGAPTDAKETSQHLVRLWANDEVKRLLTNKEDEKAMELAVKNQLVTQVTGAVVLETQQQYDQFGLKPVDPNTVPTVPEPEEYLLFGVVLAILIWFMRRFRRPSLQTI